MLTTIETVIDYILFASSVFILLGSIYITFKMRFIQVRFVPKLIQIIWNSFKGEAKEEKYTVAPHKALFTAMSTTLGMSSIVAPVMAMNIGGPGALLGFLLFAFFGSAATFTEVTLSVIHRKRMDSGAILGGPMQYMKALFSPAAGKWYALCCCILMTAWSGAQSNQLASILDSPLLGDFRVPVIVSGSIVAVLIVIALLGGIKRISSLSSFLVPIMFILYVGACLWILLSDVSKLWVALGDIISSAFSPYAMASGALVGGVVSSLRWGVFKGMQITEAGVGTQTIPHSLAETKDPYSQGIMSMVSTYTAAGVAFLSACVALVTETWQDPTLPLGINMMAKSFQLYFSHFGVAVVGICTMLFAFGTIIGNSFNGSQCFAFMTENKKLKYYYLFSGLIVFIGAVTGIKTFWSVIDIFLAFVAVPHMAALIIYSYQKSSEILHEDKAPEYNSEQLAAEIVN